ncbi:ArsR/SmtB family transcription factor [Polymorphospora rubra]|uniref:Transcriptional regulator n=1 Tax=Polymorphospora rubra TaxID=338584 RepID=A0A810MW00_9ACTN|nr:helix-turn-helix domain-containing protein [Polymorphospora rubra]BCJ65202.1 transcriptional regulator [Polymorphospora rubra]
MSDGDGEQRRLTISDPKVMRALSHPARLEIMEHLSSTGADVTATGVAELVGLSPSATSYHLRELAKFGLVEHAPSRGDARERVWRATMRGWSVDAGHDAEAQAAEQTLVNVFLERDFGRVRDWVRRSHDEPAEWYDAAVIGGPVLLLTADELREVNAKVFELLAPYRRRDRQADPPAGSRRVVVHYATVPMD